MNPELLEDYQRVFNKLVHHYRLHAEEHEPDVYGSVNWDEVETLEDLAQQLNESEDAALQRVLTSTREDHE